jgi:hypothetical protein
MTRSNVAKLIDNAAKRLAYRTVTRINCGTPAVIY